MLTVVCLYRSGGPYNPDYVGWLRDKVSQHLYCDYIFRCLTDRPREIQALGVQAIELIHNWPSWWSKLELFRPDHLSGRVLYFDLDTIICGDITWAGEHNTDLTMLRGFALSRPASGMMAWTCGEHVHRFYNKFLENPDLEMRMNRGDQEFMQQQMKGAWPLFWQDQFPGEVCGKRHILNNQQTGKESIICWSGEPRLHTGKAKEILGDLL